MGEDVLKPFCQALHILAFKELHVAAVAVGERKVQVMASVALALLIVSTTRGKVSWGLLQWRAPLMEQNEIWSIR